MQWLAWVAIVGACAYRVLGPWTPEAPAAHVVAWLQRDARIANALEGFATIWHDNVLSASFTEKLLEGKLGEFLSALVISTFGRPERVLYLAALGGMSVGVLAFFHFGLRAFPDSPSVLLLSTTNKFKLSDADAQIAFRARFRRHFRDVCAALDPRTLTIFIDDVDRCEPAKAAEILEAINYLMSNGACVVVMGLARQIVEAQLGHHFASLAQSFGRMHGSQPLAASNDGASAEALYARDYLRKLLNIEISLPTPGGAQVLQLLGAPEENGALRAPPESRVQRVARRLDALLAVAFARLPWLGLIVLCAWCLVVATDEGFAWSKKHEADRLQRNAQEASEAEKIQQGEAAALMALKLTRATERESAARLAAACGIDTTEAGANPRDHRTAAAPRPQAECGDVASDVGQAPCAAHADLSARAQWQRASLCLHQRETEVAQLRELVTAVRTCRRMGEQRSCRDELDKALAHLSAGEALSAPVASPSPVAPKKGGQDEAQTSAGGGAGVVTMPADPPSPLPWIAMALAGAALFFASFLALRDRYALRDRPAFVDALRLWSRVLRAQAHAPLASSPRELKRYINTARYFAVRLQSPPHRRGFFERLTGGDRAAQERERLEVNEALIVALTTLYYVHRDFLRVLANTPARELLAISKASDAVKDSDGRPWFGLTDEVRAVLEEHQARWPFTPEDVRVFLAAIGEFVQEDAPGDAREVPSSAQPVASLTAAP